MRQGGRGGRWGGGTEGCAVLEVRNDHRLARVLAVGGDGSDVG